MDKVKILSKYLPEQAAPIIAKWIDHFNCEFKISKNRGTKFGDYRAPFKGTGHRISVNYDLNPYAFLVTTVHEFAHLYTWNQHKGRVKPHGAEWKLNFQKMMLPFFETSVFPQDLKVAIATYLSNPAASSCSDSNLFRALKKYDKQGETIIYVENLPAKTVFQIKGGRMFVKGELVRTRYRCTEVETGRVFLFNPLAEVVPVAQTA